MPGYIDPVNVLRCGIPACRAVQRIITDPFIPGSEDDTDPRFDGMDATVYFSVRGLLVERAA